MRWHLRGVSKCWNAWRNSVATRKRHKQIFARCFTRIFRANTGRAWRKWVHFTMASAYATDASAEVRTLREKLLLLEDGKEAIMLKAASKLRNLRLMKPFMAWKSALRIRRMMRSSALKMKNASLARAFSSWTKFLNTKKKLKRILCKMKKRELSAAFWTMRIHATESAHLLSQRKRLMKMTIRRLISATKRQGFAMLKKHLVDCRKIRVVASNIMMRRSAQSFRAWASRTIAAKERKALCARVVLRIQNMRAAASFHAWQYHIRGKQKLRIAASRVVSRWQKFSLKKTFDAWMDFVDARKRAAYIVERTFLQWSRALEAGAFRRWSAGVLCARQAGKEKVLKEEHAKEMLTLRKSRTRLVLQLLRSRKIDSLYRSFCAWKKWTHRRRAHRSKTKHCLQRLKHRLEARSFTSWHRYTQRSLSMKRSAKAVLMRWTQLKVLKTFSAWRRFSAHQKHSRSVFLVRKIARNSYMVRCYFAAWRNAALRAAGKRQKRQCKDADTEIGILRKKLSLLEKKSTAKISKLEKQNKKLRQMLDKRTLASEPRFSQREIAAEADHYSRYSSPVRPLRTPDLAKRSPEVRTPSPRGRSPALQRQMRTPRSLLQQDSRVLVFGTPFSSLGAKPSEAISSLLCELRTCKNGGEVKRIRRQFIDDSVDHVQVHLLREVNELNTNFKSFESLETSELIATHIREKTLAIQRLNEIKQQMGRLYYE